MATGRNIYAARMAMFLVNLILIVFISIIIYNTTGLICEYDLARSFIEKIDYVPTIPWKVPLYSISLLVLLFVSVLFRERRGRDKKLLLYILSIVDIFICIGIIYFLNMGYKGILLIAIANIVTYIGDRKKRTLFIIVSVIIYALIDYDTFSIRTSLFSINEYIQYYNSMQRLYIFSFRNILTSVNEILFIVFMILVIQSQIDVNEKISGLYNKLFMQAEELKIVNIQLQDYARKSEEMAKTRERNRMAREIHDTIGHMLTGMATGLEACIELSMTNIEKTRNQMMKIAELARKGLLDVRRSVSALRADSLERFSLIPAIQKLSEDINECTRTKVGISVQGEVAKLSADEEETIYRVVQEGITNAVRHGGAGEIKVLMEFDEDVLHIHITDDGLGCDSIEEGFGLLHVRERVNMLNGEARYFSRKGEGFNIDVDVPIRRESKK